MSCVRCYIRAVRVRQRGFYAGGRTTRAGRAYPRAGLRALSKQTERLKANKTTILKDQEIGELFEIVYEELSDYHSDVSCSEQESKWYFAEELDPSQHYTQIKFTGSKLSDVKPETGNSYPMAAAKLTTPKGEWLIKVPRVSLSYFGKRLSLAWQASSVMATLCASVRRLATSTTAVR